MVVVVTNKHFATHRRHWMNNNNVMSHRTTLSINVKMVHQQDGTVRYDDAFCYYARRVVRIPPLPPPIYPLFFVVPLQTHLPQSPTATIIDGYPLRRQILDRGDLLSQSINITNINLQFFLPDCPNILHCLAFIQIHLGTLKEGSESFWRKTRPKFAKL